MGRESKLTIDQKLSAIKEYNDGNGSYVSIAIKLGISKTAFRNMVKHYNAGDLDAISNKKTNRRYSKELKLSAVNDYLDGKGSLTDICLKYKIISNVQLRRWILWYNGHKEFKEPSRSGTEKYMTKGRKTTQEERVEIVSFCIENNKDYGLAIEKYGVSYQQIYSWVRKYKDKGIDGLSDCRGKRKQISEMTEAEKLKLENKLLQAKLKEKEMEIALLKKLEELERGGR